MLSLTPLAVSMAEDVDRIADSDDIPGYEISDNNRSLENADHADEPSILPEEELSGGPAEPRKWLFRLFFS